jgi:hypothetical protein
MELLLLYHFVPRKIVCAIGTALLHKFQASLTHGQQTLVLNVLIFCRVGCTCGETQGQVLGF